MIFNYYGKDGMDMVNYIIRLLGGIDKFLSALIVFMVISYIAEILLVIVGEEKQSNVFLLKNMFNTTLQLFRKWKIK